MTKYPNTSIYEILKESCNKYNKKVAFIYSGIKISYSEFLNDIDICSNAFIKLGVKKNDVVTLISENTIEFITCIYALNKLGVICNMIHPLSGEEEIKSSYINTNSSYLIVMDNQINRLNNIYKYINYNYIIYIPENKILSSIDKIKNIFKKTINILDNNFISYTKFIDKGKYKNIRVKNKVSGNDNAFIISTNNKNILLTNINVNASAINFNSVGNYLIDKRYLFDYSISDGFGMTAVHKALLSGSKIILVPDLVHKTISNVILKYKPNVIECSTNVLNLIINNKKFNDKNLSYINFIICSREKLNNNLKEKSISFFKKHNSNVVIKSTFGLKESTSNVSITVNESIDSIGIPYPNIEIKVFDKELNECKDSQFGEICITGPVIMKEYLNNSDKTNKVLIKHKDKKIWLHTNDLGYSDNKGIIYFKSSLKRVIISNGNEIYPSEIENIILMHPYVQACSIVGVPHPYKKEVVKVYIVLKDRLVLNSEIKKSIKEYCEKNISSYALPYAYAYRKELPKTISGKISYQDLVSQKDEEEK